MSHACHHVVWWTDRGLPLFQQRELASLLEEAIDQGVETLGWKSAGKEILPSRVGLKVEIPGHRDASGLKEGVCSLMAYSEKRLLQSPLISRYLFILQDRESTSGYRVWWPQFNLSACDDRQGQAFGEGADSPVGQRPEWTCGGGTSSQGRDSGSS